MKAGQFTDEQIVAILKLAESGQKTIVQICKDHNLTENTFYRWRSRFGRTAPSDIARNREMEKENLRLKRLLAERDLEVDILKELLGKK